MRYDLAVIGGGTAGLVAALVAAGIGGRTVLIEAERTGGDCLWTGCVPSKSLIAAAGVAHAVDHAAAMGLGEVQRGPVDLGEVMDRIGRVQARIEPHDSAERLRSEGVEVVPGRAVFTSDHEVAVDGRRIRFRKAVVATGSAPVVPPIPGLGPDGVTPLTTDSVWSLRRLPSRLVVVGGGAVGCELGQAFSRLGSEVTLVEMTPRLLGPFPAGAAEVLAEVFASEGVAVRTGVSVAKVEPATGGDSGDGGAGTAVLSDGGRVGFDRILIAAGRRPRTAGLGLEAAGVTLAPNGAVVVDDRLRTSSTNIYAAGDVTAELPLTPVAAIHGRHVGQHAMLGVGRPASLALLPRVVFTAPEVATVGEVTGEGDNALRRIRFNHSDLDRALAAHETWGFTEVVVDGEDRVLGATVVGARAGETIVPWRTAVEQGSKVTSMAVPLAYPSWAEANAKVGELALRRKYDRPALRRLGRMAVRARRVAGVGRR
ncbi:MAG TPA: oxidoreductase [Acidimicrobiales bacterium]|nr:oxidoreductase [Acidimicrobiales bacterium]